MVSHRCPSAALVAPLGRGGPAALQDDFDGDEENPPTLPKGNPLPPTPTPVPPFPPKRGSLPGVWAGSAPLSVFRIGFR